VSFLQILYELSFGLLYDVSLVSNTKVEKTGNPAASLGAQRVTNHCRRCNYFTRTLFACDVLFVASGCRTRVSRARASGRPWSVTFLRGRVWVRLTVARAFYLWFCDAFFHRTA
jgi:hypothetical protein